MEIGAKIKRLRLQRGLTQEELADRCELSKGFISQVERDLTSPSIASLTDILECLGTDLPSFFSDPREEKNRFHGRRYLCERGSGWLEGLHQVAGAQRAEKCDGTHPGGIGTRRRNRGRKSPRGGRIRLCAFGRAQNRHWRARCARQKRREFLFFAHRAAQH